MTVRDEHPPSYRFPDQGRDPLPADFEPELRDLDALLAEQARREPVPDRLADRVFEASVGGLPRRKPLPAAGPAAVGWIQILLSSQAWRGRLAMAASLGLVFILAGLFMRGPGKTIDPPPERSIVLAAWLTEVPSDGDDDEVAHLLDTAALSSFDELTGELDEIIAEFDM